MQTPLSSEFVCVDGNILLCFQSIHLIQFFNHSKVPSSPLQYLL